MLRTILKPYSSRVLATAALAAAAVCLSFVTAVPARANPGDTTVITGPANPVNPNGPVLTVSQTSLGAVRVNNPGNVAPIDQQCVGMPDGQQTCVGASGQILFANGAQNAPIHVQRTDLYGDRIRENLGWIIDEAHQAVAAIHGVSNDDLVDSYARPEIRSYVALRLQTILEKKLYGGQLTAQESQTYDWLMRQLNSRETAKAKAVLAEYERWEADPCGYPVPAPPAGSGLPVVPNPGFDSANCRVANGAGQLYKITKGTPGIETFESWAAYRHPTPMMRLAGDPVLQQMNYNTVLGSAFITGLGAATVAAGATLIAVASSSAAIAAVTAVTGVAFFIPLEAATVSGLGGTFGFSAGAVSGAIAGATAAAAAGVVFAVVLALIAIGVSSWMIAQEQSTADTIRERAQSAGTNDDPVGIVADQARYRGLDQDTLQDPATGDKALIHRPEFGQQLMGMVQEWLAFDGDGNLVPDPQTPFDPAATEPDAGAAARLSLVGSAPGSSDPLSVKAPAGTVDSQGRPVTGHQVWLSHGWLMVSDYVRGVYQPARPATVLSFVDADGTPGVVSILRRAQPSGLSRDQFLVVRAPSGQPLQSAATDTWTFQGAGGAVQTAQIATENPRLPTISLLPTVTGDAFYPGHLLTFQSNVSDPGRNVPGRYSWSIDRLGDDGQVLDSTEHGALENLLGFQERFDRPGSYRAVVHYAGIQRPVGPFDASGVVTFTIAQPQPTVMTGALRDDLALRDQLSLNLRLQEPVDHDTLDVDVRWADDGAGHAVTRHYVVHCRALGDGGCDTDPLVAPEEAPVNPNWSESPTYRIPDDQVYLPQVTATVTNGFGQSTTLALQAPGEHRPRYLDRTPTVQMVAGSASRVRVTEVRPTTLAGDPAITILPFVDTIEAGLPAGVRASVDQVDGHWYLELFGAPRADDVGPHTFYFPVEQEPVGMGLRPAPALVTLDVVPSTTPGYRAVLRNTPATLAERLYRTGYPDYLVQVMQTLANGERFAPFTGTVMCQLSASGTVLLRQPCAPDQVFPWPSALLDDSYTAEVWVESDAQPVVPDHYSVTLGTVFLRPELTVAPSEPSAQTSTVSLAITDRRYSEDGAVPAPFSAHGYAVTCSLDDAAFAPCLDGGTMSVLRTPGAHHLTARVGAPDGASKETTVSWQMDTPPTTLALRRPLGYHAAGSSLEVVASGLLPQESYRVLVAGQLVATGHAADDGTVLRVVTIPISTPNGSRPLVVYGATPSRVGRTHIRVVSPVPRTTVSSWWSHRPGAAFLT